MVVVDTVVDMAAAVVVVVTEGTLQVEEVVVEESGVLPAGLVTGPAPATATTAWLASTQLAMLQDPLHSYLHLVATTACSARDRLVLTDMLES